MPRTPRERLARALDGSQASAAFSAQLSLPARNVQLTVTDVGSISLPIKAPQAKRMITSARPAAFGRGEETLTDLSVRDTWEITPDQVALTGLDWDAILSEVRDELGIKARLRAEPHALLVYGKGQFFLPHQDSEKHDAMIGTLVLSLPSSHTGGELVIEHGGKSATHQASSTEVTVTAFYADCRHQVKPVRSGYRVTFTYNLLLDSDPADDAPLEPSAEAARYLSEHFTTRASRWKEEPPNRLVYLLDHQYTEHGLGWNRLKGADADRAALLRAAAEDAGCETVLALAEIQETREAYDDDILLTSELTLTWWTLVPGGGTISLHVPDEEVCATTPSVKLKPYDSEYTKYMGNYGNTKDRWYRRAAIVVFPRQYAFAARAEASPQWALTELRTRVNAGDLVSARTAAESIASLWTAPGPELLEPTLQVAAGLADPGIALMLLRPFAVEMLTPAHADGMAALAANYDEAWQQALFDAWFGSRNSWRYHGGVDRGSWAAALPGITSALPEATAGILLNTTWRWLAGEIGQWLSYPMVATRRTQLAGLGKPLGGLLTATEGTALADEIVTVLRKHGDDILICLLPALRAAAPGTRAAASGTGTAFDELARDCERRLTAATEQPVRADGNWSVPWSGGCGCELCEAFGAFLAERDEVKLEWPLAEIRRKHVTEQISNAELPVGHGVWKFGSPHTLVLTKTEELFRREAQARKDAAASLEWLAARRKP
jgi:2OG-Fe(II) oxygenase superfamily